MNHRLPDQQAKPSCDFLIGLDFAAQIAAESVLVQLLARHHVPQAAAIGANLVGEDHPTVIAIPQTTELQLEINKADADAGEKAAHEIVHADRHVGDVVHLLLIGPTEAGDMLLGDHRIAKRIVLVIIFDQRARELRTFLNAEALRE